MATAHGGLNFIFLAPPLFQKFLDPVLQLSHLLWSYANTIICNKTSKTYDESDLSEINQANSLASSEKAEVKFNRVFHECIF